MTARIFGVPVCAVSLVDEYRTWHKATYGLPHLREMFRDVSLCAQVILSDRAMVVRDASVDPRFAHFPLVADAPGIRFYAGAPLKTADGYRLGALCLMDFEPRTFSRADLRILAGLADTVVNAMTLRQVAAALHAEIGTRKRNQRALSKQHRLLQRLSSSLKHGIDLRTAELTQVNASLHSENAQRNLQLRDSQQQVVQQKRMSDFGLMAAGLAHDFNNSLSLILGYSEMMMSDLVATPLAARSDEYLGTVITAAKDAAKMFGQLRGVYRQADPKQEWRLVDLNHLVEQTVGLTRPRWHGPGATIEVRTELAAGLPALLADAAQLRGLLTNLIFNAVDALPQGGTITLRTRAEAGAEPGEGGVVLEVADTGTGMDEETRRRCLEPFFTTKGKQGTGLGLAMVYGTMQRHGGSIDLQSAPGKGTMFRLQLPLRPGSEDAAGGATSAPIPSPRRILLVDHQPVFLGLMRQYLVTDWHTVETATDGPEALKKFRSWYDAQEPFDLVVTDKAVPHLRGRELAEEIKALAPQTRVILLTGMSTPEGEEMAKSPAVDLTLPKPVTRAGLRGAIARVMGDFREPGTPPRPAPTGRSAGGPKSTRQPARKRSRGAAAAQRVGQVPPTTSR